MHRTLRAVLLAGLCWALFSFPGPAHPTTPVGDETWVVRISVTETPVAEALLEEGFDVWRGEERKGFLRLAVDALDLGRLRALGYEPVVDRRQTELLQRARTAATSGVEGGGGIPGFSCYRTVEETHAAAQQILVDYPTLAAWIDIGDSWEKGAGLGGYDLFVLRLTNSAIPGPKPALFLNTAIHAREYTTAELGTRMAEHLVTQYGLDADVTWLLDHHEIHFNLQANPDGRKRAETGLSWRKNANNDHCSNSNSRGIDLNRNFEFQWGCCGGSSGSPCSGTYRGPSAGSEPETMAIVDYVRALFPDQRVDDLEMPAPSDATGVLIDIHSFGEDVLWSYGFRTAPPPEPTASAIYTLGRKMAFFNGYRPQHGSLGTVDGSTKDFAYGELGVPGFTLELGNSFFESCAAFESQVWPDNREALTYVAKVVRTPYLTPGGPETIDLSSFQQIVTPGDMINISATIDDTRYSSANGVEPTHRITGADLFVDTPPWTAEGVAVAMDAADGAFDSMVEEVTALVDTTGWSVGRHTLFVEGHDILDSTGPVSAVFVHAIDPVSAPTLQGVVWDARTGFPRPGVLRIGPFEVFLPVSGRYQLQLPPGTYDVVMEADGYAPFSQQVTLAEFEFETLNIFLHPFEARFEDSVENGVGDWVAQAPWAISDESFSSPSHAWSDSPGGNYTNQASAILTSPVVDLSDLEQVRLRFDHSLDFEPGFDFGIVEVSDGGSWQEVGVFGDFQDWTTVEIPVPMLEGATTAQVRFRMDADTSQVADGWHLDDIAFEGVTLAPPVVVFLDGFENGDTSAWSSTSP